MKAFVTGSQVYGEPSKASDVDLVVLVSYNDLTLLLKMADKTTEIQRGRDSDAGPTAGGESASMRFGDLNLIAVTDPLAFEVWRRGTRALIRYSEKKSVTRELSVRYFGWLRSFFHLYGAEPTPEQVVRKLSEEAVL